MKKPIFLMLAGLFLFFNLARAGVNLSGTVTEINQNGEQPVSGADLQALGTTITDVSDTDGSFTLENIPADSYGFSIKATKDGYVPSYTMPVGIGEENETGIPVIILSNFVYNFLVQGGDAPGHQSGKGDILGTVFDINGGGTAGVSIEARYIDDNSQAGTVMYVGDSMNVDGSMTATGSSGIFIIYNVDPERPVQIYTTSGGTFSSAMAIAYPDSLTFAGIFQTSGNVSKNGTVFNEEDNPVPDVNVSVQGLGISTVSAGDGSFTLNNLPDFSPVIFKLSKTGYIDTYFEEFVDTEEDKTKQEEGDDEGGLFIISQTAYDGILSQAGITHEDGKGDIGGNVGEGRDIAGAVVKLYDKDGNEITGYNVYYFNEDGNIDPSLTATTSDSGFIIPNLAPGFYYLTATKQGFEFQIVGIPVFSNGITIKDELINWPPIQFLLKQPPSDGDTQVETSSVASNATDVPVLKFDLFPYYPDIYNYYFTQQENVVIHSIKFSLRGTGDASTDLSSTKLYYSSDGNTYTLAGTASSITSTEILFDGMNVEVGPSQNNFWLLKFDFNGNAEQGDTFAADILKNSDIVSTDSQTGRDVTCHGDPITGNTITIASPPEKPTNTSPANGATGVNPTNYTLTASVFSPGSGSSVHQASQWQIRKDTETYDTFTFDSGTDTTNKTSISTPVPLESLTTYYWRVRYQNGDGVWSEWSDETSFTTGTGGVPPPGRPTNDTPPDGATEIDPKNCTLTTTDFVPLGVSVHVASQWQIREDTETYETATFDSGRDTINLTSITIPSNVLHYNTTYYWHVRYQDENGAWSDWSEETSFTTQTRQPGDINGDGNVDISDVILCLRIAIGLDPFDPIADINGDEQVDISDVILVLRIAIGLD